MISNAKEALKKASKGTLAYHANACVKCGLCGETCHIYKAMPCPENLPGAKASKVINLYKRYNTILGKYFPKLIGAKSLSEKELEELKETVYGRCTCCGRCGINCSVGSDIGSIIRTGRKIVSAAGRAPDNLMSVVKNQLRDGNQMSITAEEVKETANWLSEDLKLELQSDDINIEIDAKGKRVLYLVNPREIKFFPLSFSAAAGVFHAAGESFTVASEFFDVTNYGLFSGSDEDAKKITQKVIDKAIELEVEEIILSECGHGFRAFRWEGANWLGMKYPIKVRSMLEITLDYIKEGKIKVDPRKNTAPVTLHDPCNLVRWGGIIEPQREILKHVVSDFREMTPNRLQNFCCGGGGGMLSMSEYGDRRIKSGSTKAEQIKNTKAKIVATPCHNCADQLLELNKKYELKIEILAISELVYNALVLP